MVLVTKLKLRLCDYSQNLIFQFYLNEYFNDRNILRDGIKHKIACIIFDEKFMMIGEENLNIEMLETNLSIETNEVDERGKKEQFDFQSYLVD